MTIWRHAQVIMASGSRIVIEGPDPFPEDVEESDRRALQTYIDAQVKNYFDRAYPDFEPQVIVGNNKEYYLPALKVLKFYKDKFISPSHDSVWENMELKAVCQSHTVSSGVWGTIDPRHDAPDDNCDCGIYGSVNLEEIYGYLNLDYSPSHQQYTMGGWDDSTNGFPARMEVPKAVLCIIEPSPDAKVIRARKGWKASHAFISEIIGQTMSLDEASQLLSIAWHRNIDVRSVYENR